MLPRKHGVLRSCLLRIFGQQEAFFCSHVSASEVTQPLVEGAWYQGNKLMNRLKPENVSNLTKAAAPVV